jgi:RNA polymerase sigma factor (sigma-70 family)
MFTAAVSKVGDNNLHPEDMEALTKQYQRLVWKIAHKLARGDKEMYVEFVQDGFLGLLEAAKRWSRKKARKTRFNTYAYIAIRHAMITAVGTRQTKAFCADCKAKEEMISLRESFRGMICPVCGAQSPREQRCHDVSLDDEIVAGLCMREVLPFKGLSPDALAERAEIEERIQALPERLRYVITERLDGKTLKGLGLSMDITRERIRQRKKMPSTA